MVCSEMLEYKSVNKIGGAGCTVEVDESMFGHRKVRLVWCPCKCKTFFKILD